MAMVSMYEYGLQIDCYVFGDMFRRCVYLLCTTFGLLLVAQYTKAQLSELNKIAHTKMVGNRQKNKNK